VFIDQVNSTNAHTLDLVYHNVGTLMAPPGARLFTPSAKAGYSYLRNTQSVSTEQGLQLEFGAGDGGRVQWIMAGGSPTTFVVGTGVGAHTEDRVPVVLARRQAAQTAYLWCLQLGRGSLEPLRVEEEAVGTTGERLRKKPGAAALQIHAGSRHYLLAANPPGDAMRVGGRTIQARIVFLEQDPAGAWQWRHGAP
jgi:hypothetical protein